MFCRNCGKDIAENPKVCPNCSSSPIKGTSFCRYCGGPTNEQDVTCPKCEAVLKTTGKAGPGQGWSKKTKQRLIVAAAIIVVVYAIMAMPPRFVVKPVESAISGWVLSNIGYTANPLRSISANPSEIPVPVWGIAGQIGNSAHFAAGETQQLVISAQYTKDAAIGSGGSKDITNNCTFQSSNEQVAAVSSIGLVQAVATGTASIKVIYTAIPGSSNFSSASKGKIPVTLTVSVAVTVD